MKTMKSFAQVEIYNALVQPYFDHCSPFWDNCGRGLRDKLKRIQNRAARVIRGSTLDTLSVDVLNVLGWESLDMIRKYTKSVYIRKKFSDLAALNLKQFF